MLKIFNGWHTLTNKTTGNHRTFQIRTVRKGALEGKRVLALLTGPNNESDWTNFAFVDDDKILVWKKFRGEDSTWEKYGKLIQKVLIEKVASWADLFYHQLEGRCFRCNRRLTHPESISSGIGPECAGKLE